MQEFYHKPDKFRQWLKDQWGINVDGICHDIRIEGSPERTLSRAVIREKDGRLFLLDKFGSGKFELRNQVASVVEYLNEQGLSQAARYYRSRYGELLPFYGTCCFQLSDYFPSTTLQRPEYLLSDKMGVNFARFLVCLSDAAKGIGRGESFLPFSIKTYVYQIFKDMKQHDSNAYYDFLPILDFLEKKFMQVHDTLPLAFSHGDLHPLNVIWDNEKIKAVIDWEFAGVKPDIFDAANLIGCAGIEDPNGLGQPMVLSFIGEMKKQNCISDLGWRYFPEYVVALRFAWLSEWLRKKDRQMIEMEEVYMKLLVDNIEMIRQGWGLDGKALSLFQE